MKMRNALLPVLAFVLVMCTGTLAHAADWVYLGQAHVDGPRDHDVIQIGKAAGRYRFLQVRVNNGPIEFDRIVVHYGNGEPEVLQVRDVIRPGSRSRAIALQGDRFVQSFELWYGKTYAFERRPQLTLWGRR